MKYHSHLFPRCLNWDYIDLIATAAVPAAGSTSQIQPRPRTLPQVTPLSSRNSRPPLPMATPHWKGWSKRCAPLPHPGPTTNPQSSPRPSGLVLPAQSRRCDSDADAERLPLQYSRRCGFPHLRRYWDFHSRHSSALTRAKVASLAAWRMRVVGLTRTFQQLMHGRFCLIRTPRPAAASVSAASPNALSRASSGPATRISTSTSDD